MCLETAGGLVLAHGLRSKTTRRSVTVIVLEVFQVTHAFQDCKVICIEPILTMPMNYADGARDRSLNVPNPSPASPLASKDKVSSQSPLTPSPNKQHGHQRARLSLAGVHERMSKGIGNDGYWMPSGTVPGVSGLERNAPSKVTGR